MQLTIFDQLEPIQDPSDIITQKANDLLFALNDGRKKKDLYLPQYYWHENGNIVLMACNREKHVVFNIIDGTTGETPANFSSCWRNLEHIKNDLNE